MKIFPSIKIELNEDEVSRHFRACAAYLVATAIGEVFTILRHVKAQDVPGLTFDEWSKLRNFQPDAELTAQLEQGAARTFLSGRSGARRLYARAYREIAQQAIRQSVVSYSRSLGIPPADFYRSKYELLFQRLGLPLYRISRVDPNLNNDMPHSSVRPARLRPAGSSRQSNEASAD